MLKEELLHSAQTMVVAKPTNKQLTYRLKQQRLKYDLANF